MKYSRETLVTAKDLTKAGCCDDVAYYFEDEEKRTLESLFDECVDRENYYDYTWALVYLMDFNQKYEWAIFCAESCIHIYEKEFPDDNRPRLAIEAAKEYQADPTEENRIKCREAAFNTRSSALASYAALATYTVAISAAAYDALTAFAVYDAALSARAAANAGIDNKLILNKGFEILVGESND